MRAVGGKNATILTGDLPGRHVVAVGLASSTLRNVFNYWIVKLQFNWLFLFIQSRFSRYMPDYSSGLCSIIFRYLLLFAPAFVK